MEDAALLAQILTGGAERRAAEGELFRRYAPRVRLYGLRHLKDEDRARDLVQAVMLAVFEAARQGRVQEHDKVDRFVLGTSRNVAARMREVEARARPLRDDGDGEDDEVTSTFEVSFERLDSAALLRCVSKLEERMRTVLALSFIEERRAEEIAAVLSTSAGNVRVLRHRALFALRGCLDGGAS